MTVSSQDPASGWRRKCTTVIEPNWVLATADNAADAPDAVSTPRNKRKADGLSTASAKLCFLSPHAFVGFIQLPGEDQPLQLTGNESRRQCDMDTCGADDCCMDEAFVIRVVDGTRQRRFVARNAGIGDYAGFQGHGFAFQTETVLCSEDDRSAFLRDLGDRVPPGVGADALLCVGVCEIAWATQRLTEARVETPVKLARVPRAHLAPDSPELAWLIDRGGVSIEADLDF